MDPQLQTDTPLDRVRRLLHSRWPWCIITAALTVFFVVKMQRHMRKWEQPNDTMYLADFVKIHNGAVRLREGRPLYEGAQRFREGLAAGKPPLSLDWSEWYAYPPLVAAVLQPAAGTPVAEVGRVWQWLNIVLLPAAVLLAVGTVGRGHAWVAAPLMLLAVYMWPVRFNYYQGQVEVAMLFAFSLSACLLRRGWDSSAGAVLGLVAACKVYPVFLGVGLLIAGRLRGVAAMAGAAIAATLFGIALTDWTTFTDFVDVAGLKSHPALAGWPSNQSIRGFLNREWHEGSGNHLFPAASHRPELVAVLQAAALAGFLLAYLAVEWRKRTSGWSPLALSTAIATQILLLPFADSYYATNLLLPLAVAFAAAADRPLRRRLALAAMLAASIYLAGARDSDWLKEEDIFSEGRAFADTFWNNVWISRVWLGELGIWGCLTYLRATEPATSDPARGQHVAGC